MLSTIAGAVFYPSQVFISLITFHSGLSCFSLPLLFLFINQLYRVERNLSIFIPLLLFSLMECQELLSFWRASLYHGLLKPTLGFKSCDHSSHSWWQIQLYTHRYIQNFRVPHQSLVSLLSCEKWYRFPR